MSSTRTWPDNLSNAAVGRWANTRSRHKSGREHAALYMPAYLQKAYDRGQYTVAPRLGADDALHDC